MTPTPFKRRLPERFVPSVDAKAFQWWPWPVGIGAAGFGLDYPANGVLPPREVLDWLSVAEWRFEVELDDYYGGSFQSVDQLVQPGGRYVKTYDMGAPEVQGRVSTSLIGNMQLGYTDVPGTDAELAFCGIEMSWRENIDDFRYTYGFIIDLTFPSFGYDESGDPFWSMNPKCRFRHEISNLDGSSPDIELFHYVNFLGDDYNAPPANWITLSRVTIGSML